VALYQNALKMAYTDPLTQVNNRTSFNELMRREMSLAFRHSKNLSLVFLDIDHFKAINDDYGHECGDFALAAVAKCIKSSLLRDSDMIFRFGGEEFVVLLSETDLAGAELVAERIRSTIESHTLSYDMSTINFTVSLGVSTLHADDDAESLLKRADEAMYKAKRNGRNRVETCA
jgi:diguanylate cyclase (GGDEF)-like protein